MPSLLVDVAVLRLLGQSGLLERSEWTIETSPGGRELLERATASTPDLVVLCDSGPAMWDLVEAFRAESDAASRPRLLLVAAHPLEAERREALAGAGVTLLEPPITLDALALAIGRAMDVPTRVTVRVPVVFEVKGRTAKDNTVHGRMRDVSTGGFRLESDLTFTRGEVLYCFFTLSPLAPVIFASAQVAHGPIRRDGQREYGLEFVDIRLEDRRRIAEFVLRHASGLATLLA